MDEPLRLSDDNPELSLCPDSAANVVACLVQSPLLAKQAARRRLQETPPAEEDCGSSVIQLGDGVCDARLNTESCNFDGGDCCAQTCVQNPLLPDSCLYFDCVDPDINADVSATRSNAFGE